MKLSPENEKPKQKKNDNSRHLERKQQEKRAQRRREMSVPTMIYDAELPVSARREEIRKAIQENQIVVLCGETGSGKSTQLPKICLELGLGVRKLIGHTQPRRIAAISIANRLAQELALGKQKPAPEGETLIPPEKLVGYKIRFTDHTSPETCIKLMTDGILLAETQGDRFLNQYEALIIDEAHERSLNIDFLIGILRRLADKRPDLKIIITSATIDAERFAAHFETGTRKVPILKVEGRTYPVDVIYQPVLEEDDDDEENENAGNAHSSASGHARKDAPPRVVHDGDIHQAVIRAAEMLAQKGPGDMLVFVPSERDIHELVKLFHGESQRRTSYLFQRENVEILPLYARLPADQQQKIFNPTGKHRRIVLATNVAESSVTVPRIRYVIDTGTARISRYSARSKTQRLPIEPISQASADQRKGRCGRIGPGICVRLYSEEDFNSREEYTQPEIQRTNLASVILQTKMLKLGRIEAFPFLDMPKIASIRDGYRTLFELKAITRASAEGDLTPLGIKLAKIPVDPRIGRMILEAVEIARRAESGKASVPENNGNSGKKQAEKKNRRGEKRKSEMSEVNPLLEILVIAAALEIRDPRERPLEKQGAADAAHERFLDSKSDFLSFLKLWDFYFELKGKLSRNQLLKACRQNFISWNRMREWIDVYHQLRELVQQLLKESRLPEKLLHGDAERLSFTEGSIPPGENHSAKYTSIHRALLSGLLANIGRKDLLTNDYAVGNGKCVLWPGSGLLKSVPAGNGNGNTGKFPEKDSGKNSEKNAESGKNQAPPMKPKAGVRFWGRNLDASGKPCENGEDFITGEVAKMSGTAGTAGTAGMPEAPKKRVYPTWVMAAEMVETSKRFLRTNAIIEPEWVEPLAEHLATHAYSEPHWSKQNNDVMAYEKVSLSGLVIVPKRRVPYARVNPKEAREMFIQQGLVEGNWQSRADFYLWNRELWFELEQIQAKLRRFDYLPGTWKLYEFYDTRIPETVTDHTTLEKWLRTADTEAVKALEMKEEDLVSETPDASLSEQFPDTFSGEFTWVSKPIPMKKPAKSGVSSEMVGEKSEKDAQKEKEQNADAPATPMRELRLFGQVITPKTPAPTKKEVKTHSSSPTPQKTPEDKNKTPENNAPTRKTSSYQFPLEYRFEPGSAQDGVTIHATLETVHQLQEHALEWGVPGLLAERVAALIRALPKEQRRKLIPAPDTARAICARIPFGVGNLRAVLATEFTRIAGELIRERDLDMSKIPESLQLNIRVSDTQGNTLVESRDLHEVLEHVGEQASEKFAMVEDSRWTRGGFTSWSFGDLPIQVQIESTLLDAASRAGKITAFPMLVDEGKTVGIRLSTSQFQAELNIQRAVIRLFRIAANRELTQQAVWMPKFNEMKMQADYFVKSTGVPFSDTICDLVAYAALEPEGFPTLADMPSLLNRVPRTQREFEKIVKQGKGRISIVVQELPQSLEQLWKAYHSAIRALNGLCTQDKRRPAVNDLASQLKIGTLQIKTFGNPDRRGNSDEKQEKQDGLPSRVALYAPFQPIVDDINAQIHRLTPPDFLLRTSWKYVRHFSRYFRGIEARIQSLSGTNSGVKNALSRGTEQIQELKHFQEEYDRIRRDYDLRGIESEELEAFRWAIEEYRISLFAQKLGTSIPVSARRLEKMLETL